MRTGQNLRLGARADAQTQKPHSTAISLLLLAIACPSTLTFYLGGSKFYAARLAVAILLGPALLLLFRKGRQFIRCDFFTSLASAWMIAAVLIGDRYGSLSSTLAVVLEFWGGYMVARGFIFGQPAIESFIGALKVVIVIAVAAAMLDHLSGRLVLNSVIGPLVGVPLDPVPEYRAGLVRAMSIFPHPILYGTFCAASGAVFLYARQWAFVALSFFGCLLAMSSAPLLVFVIAFAVYGYDSMLKGFSWRWKLFATIIVLFFGVIILVTNHPTSWIIAHLTLDPSTGYFRQATWDRAFYNIGLSPLAGYGFDEIGNSPTQEFFDNASVDAVWLVLALRFGLPIIPLLLLANISSFYGARRHRRASQDVYLSYLSRLRTGFTLAVWVLMLAGLTVHYWNSMWLFWGVCLGIRAGLQENSPASQAARADRLSAAYDFAAVAVPYRR